MGPGSGKSKSKGLTFADDTKAAPKYQHPSCFGSTDNLSNKSRKRNSSDSPSASATNEHGCDVTMTRLRSVLCHPLGLPLLYAFEGKDPSELQCLAKTRGKTSPEAKQDDVATNVAEIEAEAASENDDDEEVGGDKKKPAAEENTDDDNGKELAAKDSKGGKGRSPVNEGDDEEMEYAAAPPDSRQDEIVTDKVLLESVTEWRKYGTGENRMMTCLELRDQLRRAGQNVSGKKEDLIARCEEHGLSTTTTQGKPEEDDLTRLVAEKINQLQGRSLGYYAHSEVRLKGTDTDSKSQPRIDVLLSPAEKSNGNGFKSTPFAAIEFGLNGGDWSKKLDQNVKYLDMMVSGVAADTLQFEDPILCGVVTIEDEPRQNRFQMKTGVFLCSRRDLQDDSDEFRMSLLWHTIDSDIDSASKSFGLLLRITNDFSSWVKEDWPEDYEYLSSSCCRCKYQGRGGGTDEFVVLRSYDSRVRTGTRNPAIYLDMGCQGIVGIGTTRTVFEKFPGDDGELDEQVDDRNPLESRLWRQKGGIKIISTPYRDGGHVAASPAAFVPIIRQLQRLHSRGYVHGDIRAFNVVFGDELNKGWLIDFDYGGLMGRAFYPQGYKDSLADGSRLGQELHVIKPAEDWYALGTLIFDIHAFEDDTEDDTNDCTPVAAKDPEPIVFENMDPYDFQKAVDAAEPGDIEATVKVINEILKSEGGDRLRDFAENTNCNEIRFAKVVLETSLKSKQVEKELKEEKKMNVMKKKMNVMKKTWGNGEERSDDEINALVSFLEEVQHTKYGPSVKFKQCLDRTSRYAAVNAATTKATKTVLMATGTPFKKPRGTSKAAVAPAPAPAPS